MPSKKRKKAKKFKKRAKKRAKRIKTRISKPLSWVGKYLMRVARKMPMMPMPTVVRSFRPNPRRQHLTLGSCCRSDRTINLATHSLKETKVNGRRRHVLIPLSQKEILLTFAHELSHFVYDEHGYEQEWYGKTIFNTFGLNEPCPHCGGRGKVPAIYENE